jgi:hypothetical protein
MDRTKYQAEGMKWFLELELLSHPQVVNNLKLNILAVSPKIREVELLIYREQKSMLVLLDLTWIGRKFFKKRISEEVQDILSQMLPSFRFRITDDPKIMEMAINLVKKALTGGNYDQNSNPSNGTNKHGSQQQSGIKPQILESGSRIPQPSSADQEKQPEVTTEVSSIASNGDLKKE